MFQRINCIDIRKSIISECKDILNNIKDIDPRLGIISINPNRDDMAYFNSIVSLATKLGVTLQISRHDNINTPEEIVNTTKIIKNFINCQIVAMCPIIVIGISDFLFENDIVIPDILDVDCIDVHNRGMLFSRMNTFHKPITAMAVLKVIDYIYMEDMYPRIHAVVFGRGKIGQDIASLLVRNDIAVTTVNSTTPKELKKDLCDDANVIITATGNIMTANIEDLIGGKYDKLIIDVGFTADKDGNFSGDIYYPDNFDPNNYNTENRAIYYTTAKGGIGSITTAILMNNVFNHAITFNLKK